MSDTPEQIHGWLQTHLSVARFYGGCKVNGKKYQIDYQSQGQPLVRQDILRKLKQERRAARVPTHKPIEAGV